MNRLLSTGSDPATVRLQAQLSEAARRWQDRLATTETLTAEIRQRLVQVARDLDRHRREFDSKVFVVLIFGPLKSGKSTLVNCLVGKDVSPVDLGISSTKRPSIILGNDSQPTSVEQYFPVDRNPQLRHEAFDEVMACLRGVSDTDTLASWATRSALNPSTVLEELRREPSPHIGEPLITAIRVTGNDFLDDGMAVMDSPGLNDPANQGPHEKTAVAWAMEKADLCVLVSSSLAAPDGELLKFVGEVVRKSSAPPLLLLQNRFEARLWRRRESVEGEFERQRQAMRERVVTALGDAAQKAVVGEHAANLGFASDRRFCAGEVDAQRQQDLRIQDTLEEFEDTMRSIVKTHRGPLKRINCVNRVRELVRSGNAEQPPGATRNALDQCRQSAQAVIERHRQELAALTDLSERVVTFQHSPDGLWLVKSQVEDQTKVWAKSLGDKREVLNQSWQKIYGTGDPNWKEMKIRKQIPGKRINDACAELAAEIAQELGTRVFNPTDAFGVQLTNVIAHELNQTEGRYLLPHLNTALSQLRLQPVASLAAVEPAALPKPADILGGFDTKTLKEDWFLPLIEKRYNTNEAQAQVDRVRDQIANQMRDFSQRYETALRSFGSEQAKTRKEQLLAHLAAQTSVLSTRWKNDLRCAETALTLVDELSRDMDTIAASANAVDVSLVLSTPGR